MAKVKLVSESLQDHVGSDELNEQALNESAKGQLKKFVKNPEKEKHLTSAYARQLGKVNGLKKALLKLDNEEQVKFVKQSLEALEGDPKKGYPWLQIKDNRIVGGGALGTKKGELIK